MIKSIYFYEIKCQYQVKYVPVIKSAGHNKEIEKIPVIFFVEKEFHRL